MKMESNILGIRGKVGNLVFKKYKTGTVITRYPDLSRAGCSALQRAHRSRFQQAIILTKEALADPGRKRCFQKRAGKGSAWNKALAFFLKKSA
jgi:hypothetical protein